MQRLVKAGEFIINLDAIAEAERQADGSIVLLYIGDRTSTLLPGEQTDELWEMLERASRSPKAFTNALPKA